MKDSHKRRKVTGQSFPELFFSTKATSAKVSLAVKRGEVRKLGPRLYTTRLDLEPAELVRRHWREVVAGYFPAGVIGFRTALDGKPTAEGDVFLSAHSRRVVSLDGLRISAVEGPGALDGDMPLPHGLFWASRARALLEAARPSRSVSGAPRGMRAAELEAWLERFLQIEGADRLNQLRDDMRRLALAPFDAEAPLPDAAEAFQRLDGLIGTRLGTRQVALSAPAARARVAQVPFDAARVELMSVFHERLAGMLLPAPPDPAPTGRAARHLAFLDAYFSNCIEGTEFDVGEAREVVFAGKVIPGRADDTHDIVGTFELVSDPRFMHSGTAAWTDPDAFLAELQAANRQIMRGRPARRPGEFKTVSNRAGATVFVDPALVSGTLREGYALVRALEHPLARAAALMFLISEVRPFDHGNGRVARAFMSAELVAAGHCRILIPTVFREDDIGGLRALSRQGRTEPFLDALQYAQRVTSQIMYDDLDHAIQALTDCHAFDDNDVARLRLPPSAN